MCCQLFAQLNIPIGIFTEEGCRYTGCRYMDLHRVYGAEYKVKNESKKRRKVLRGQKKRKENKKQQKDGVTYGAGQIQ